MAFLGGAKRPEGILDRKQNNPLDPTGGCLLGGDNVPCIYRTPGGVIVADSGLSGVAAQRVTSIVRAQLLPIVC